MAKPQADFRILDKDLGRISNAERAMAQSARPLLRLGLALGFIGLVALIALQAFGGQPALGMVVAGFAVAAYLALSLGANDVSNALGPAVGAGAISMTKGLILVAILEVMGAVLGGSEVTQTLSENIVDLSRAEVPGQVGWLMLIALLTAGTWISLATRLDAPVSTTHSIVGAIVGAGAAAYGLDAVEWGTLLVITIGWLVSPLVGGVIAAGFLALLHSRVQDAPDRRAAALRWLPGFVGLVGGVFVAFLLGVFVRAPILYSLLGGLIAAALSWWQAYRVMTRQLTDADRLQVATKKLFAPPLVATALIMAFAHGANDAANVAAPLTLILASAAQAGGREAAESGLVLLIAGMGIAVGILLFGRRLVHMVGSSITRLNPLRALCITLATATTVIGFSAIGMPVSTTQVAVGCVFGVGFYREWYDRQAQKKRAPLPAEETRRRHLVRRSHLRTILFAWLITLPITAGLAAVITRLALV